MLKEREKQKADVVLRLKVLSLATLIALLLAPSRTSSSTDFDRNYPVEGGGHLAVSNVTGNIRVSSWNKSSISVKAITRQPSLIAEDVAGSDITIRVKRQFRPTRVDFDVTVPTEASLSLSNFFGNIEVKSLTGHISISAIDGDVHLMGISSSSLDVKVTSGDIYFDGELHEGGSYALQTMKGDVDVTLPKGASFNLNARALSENINLGSFVTGLTGGNKSSKGISGTHLRGGPRLNLTTYAGRIIMHNK
ncbi:MAG TPA: DUF4097 family beta strand repeat-containing protein [Blastocatellia bacterium]|nr:DUF4097 family beta strand repeat-containing protein [Blastocatellia bacterium]